MKYAIFSLACLAVVPAAIVFAYSRKWLGRMMVLMMLPVLFQRYTAINFCSVEFYRGTVRGFEVSLCYLAAAMVILSLAVRGRRIRLLPEAGAWLYLAYFLWSCLSLRNCANVQFGCMELMKMVMMYVVYVAVYNWLEAGGRPKDLLAGFGVVLVYNFLAVVKQHVTGVWQTPGTFQHQNSLALYALLVAPTFLSRYLNVGGRAAKHASFVVFACASACLVRTFSRGAIACLPVACLVTTALSFARNFSARLFSRIAPLAAIGLAGALAILPLVVVRFQTAARKSGEGRVEFARLALNMIRDKPWIGVGINNWGIKVNPPYTYWVGTGRRTAPGEGGDDYKDGIVETVYLLTAAECGLPALAIMLAWYGHYLLSCLRLTKRLAGTAYFYLPAGIAGGLVGCYMQSCLEWILKQATSFAEMMVLFAVVSYLNRNWRRLRAKELKA